MKSIMAVQDENNDPVTAMRDHSVQKPRDGPDPILQARSPRHGHGSAMRRGSSIGVGGGTGGAQGQQVGILRESSIPNNTANNFNDDIHNKEESSDESLGGFHGYNVKDSISRDTTYDTSTVHTNGTSTVEAAAARRRVRWSKGVKSTTTASCSSSSFLRPSPGCGIMADNSGEIITDMYRGLLDKLSEMQILSKIDANAKKMTKGLEGCGTSCVGGTRMLGRACGHALDKGCERTMDNKDGKYECVRCSSAHYAGRSLGVEEVNDLVYYRSRDNNMVGLVGGSKSYENDTAMRETLFETRDAIKESRDAIVASRDAILNLGDQVREGRQCVEDSRNVMGDCREAIIQSNNVAMRAREDELNRAVARKRFTFDEPDEEEEEECRDALTPMMSSPRRHQRQMIQQYHHSTSLRAASLNNVETGMGNGGMIPAYDDPFSSSMHNYQRSPPHAAGHDSPLSIMTTTPPANGTDTRMAVAPSPSAVAAARTSSEQQPASILKSSSFGRGNNTEITTTPKSRAIASPVSARDNAHRMRQLGRRGKRGSDNNNRTHRNMAFSTKNASVRKKHSSSNASAGSLSVPNSTSARGTSEPTSSSSAGQQQQRQGKGRKKRGNIVSRMVVGGIKKPLKFMAAGARSNMKNTRARMGRSKRTMHITR